MSEFKCQKCKGYGKLYKKCHECDGKGTYHFGSSYSRNYNCEKCGGDGQESYRSKQGYGCGQVCFECDECFVTLPTINELLERIKRLEEFHK